MKKTMKRFLFIPLLICLSLLSCQTETVFEQSPAVRTQEQLMEFEEMLKEAPFGWEMVYFPKVDSLLFINASDVLKSTAVQSEYYGYGGYIYYLDFKDNRKVEIRTEDIRSNELTNEVGEYAVRLNSSIQLSFTTYTSIHKLINSELEGVADFLYLYKDFNNHLVFATANEQDGKRSYITLKPVATKDQWENDLREVKKNRELYEQMKNPQIRLKIGGRTIYQSDVRLTSSELKQERERKRYHLFLYELQEYGGVIHKGYNALGSGYVPTPEGISFRPGFYHSSKVIFRDFKREGKTFVSELVSVYNPLLRKFQNESKHLYPDGEVTNYVAEIYDAE